LESDTVAWTRTVPHQENTPSVPSTIKGGELLEDLRCGVLEELRAAPKLWSEPS
jgi:hypothetical protein